MFTRKLVSKIVASLRRSPAVAIVGPRQVGKTTLARQIGAKQKAIYLDLENPEHVQRLQEPVHYLGLHADKLVIIDEVQRYPDLLVLLINYRYIYC